MLTGENGILNRVAEAKEKNSQSAKDEIMQLNDMEEMISSNGNDYIKNDDLQQNKELKTFITEWTVNSGDTIILPIYEKQEYDEERGEIETYFNYDFTVNYGDGTVVNVESYDDENRKHTYSNAGTYTVKIDGKCEGFGFNFVSESKEKLTKLVQWGVIEAKHYDFSGCSNLKGTIPLPSRNSFNNVESFRLLFYNCKKITGNIPDDLFKYAYNVTTMANTFNWTSSLTGSIPENLFVNCRKITNFRFTFAGTNLSGNVPGNLFKNNSEVINLDGTFSDCLKLEGEMPSYIFSYSDKIKVIKSIAVRNNLTIKELYLNSPNIEKFENNSIDDHREEFVIIHLPKDSTTEKTIREKYNSVEYLKIEYI